jgi:hypothetical protein
MFLETVKEVLQIQFVTLKKEVAKDVRGGRVLNVRNPDNQKVEASLFHN